MKPGRVQLTKSGPLAELLAVGNLDQGDLVLGAQGDHELLVGLLLAGLVEHAHVRLSSVQGLGGLAQAAGETVVHQSELEDALERVEDGHLALGGGIAGDFDLLRNFGSVVLFYVRLRDPGLAGGSFPTGNPAKRERGVARLPVGRYEGCRAVFVQI